MRRLRPGRLLLAGVAGLVYLFLQLPLLIVFPISFSSAQYLQFPPPGWSLQWYERYLNSPNWLTPTWLSLKVAVATTVLSLLLGVPLAFGLTRARFWGRDAIEKLSMAPIIVPTIVLSIALYGLFANLKLTLSIYLSGCALRIEQAFDRMSTRPPVEANASPTPRPAMC